MQADNEQLAVVISIAKAMNDAVIVTEAALEAPGPRIVYVNPAFTRVTRYQADEVLGRTPRLLQGPGTDRAELQRMRRCLSRGGHFSGRILNYAKDGSELLFKWHITALRDGDGAVTHWVSVQHTLPVTAAGAAADPAGARLTRRQRDILRQLRRGLSNEAIAQELGISINTVKSYVTRLMKILKVDNRTQAALLPWDETED
ncbi:MAG: LuxR C-terminal-related transcriptional regulator [Rhodospirillales bacterium]|nr:LuxR C-terminal-related transcriptional regulator [Rhodospirillales bacterium]